VGGLALWAYTLKTTQTDMNVGALTVFAMYTASAAVTVTGGLMAALRGEQGLGHQIVTYGTFYGEFGAAGATLGLFNYVTRDTTSRRKLFVL
jgi:cytochrome b